MKYVILEIVAVVVGIAIALCTYAAQVPAHAAPVDAAGCDYLATVDTVKIWQCVDFDGDKFLASTGAFLEYAKDGE